MAEAGTNWKKHFSGFGGRAYLDCAAEGPFPRETVEEVRRALRYKEHPEEITEALFEDLPARVRSAAARLIGCHPDSIAVGSGASHGINVAARGLPLKSGDEVLIARGEFPAVIYPWLNQEDRGIRARFVAPATGHVVEAAEMIKAIGPKTRVIATSLVSFSTGYRTDLQAIGDACRERGLFLVVDGAQGVGAVDFRVGDFPIDVLAVSGYKWLLGPVGTGFTYVSPRILGRLKVGDVNWLGVDLTAHYNRASDYVLKFKDGARRFDIPETASFLNVSALAASIEFVNRVRVPTVEAHVTRLLDRLLRGIEATSLKVVSDLKPKRRSTILALEGGTIDATRRVYRRLREKGVVVSLRANLVRVSPNIYNGPEEIDRVLEAAAG